MPCFAGEPGTLPLPLPPVSPCQMRDQTTNSNSRPYPPRQYDIAFGLTLTSTTSYLPFAVLGLNTTEKKRVPMLSAIQARSGLHGVKLQFYYTLSQNPPASCNLGRPASRAGKPSPDIPTARSEQQANQRLALTRIPASIDCTR